MVAVLKYCGRRFSRIAPDPSADGMIGKADEVLKRTMTLADSDRPSSALLPVNVPQEVPQNVSVRNKCENLRKLIRTKTITPESFEKIKAQVRVRILAGAPFINLFKILNLLN